MQSIDYTGVIRPMTKVDKAKWVEALRSGTYAQGTQALYLGNGYCCLGVANAELQLGVPWEGGDLRPQGQKLFLPSTQQDRCIVMNDEEGKSFSQIADYIEQNIPAVDEVAP